MKKYKWVITALLLFIIALDVVFLVSIKMKNIDMTDMRFFVTYWKEQTLSVVLVFVCYLGIKKALND